MIRSSVRGTCSAWLMAVAVAQVAPIALAQSAQTGAASGYPNRPIRLVVPFPPGGYADVTSRLIANDLSTRYGQPVTVENRAGAGGNIGTEIVARAAPDGYTLLMGTIGTNALNAHLYRKLSYDPITSFDAVSFVADAETVLVVHPSVTAGTVAELVALAKSKSGGLPYASAGAGTTSHLAAELFQARAGAPLLHVPYKGNAPALNDLVAGQVLLSFATLQTALPFIQAGKLKALAVLSPRRSSTLPQTPTLTEAGVAGLDVRNWAGILVPAGTPPAIVAQLHADISRFMRSPDMQGRLGKAALAYSELSPREFAAFIRSESEKWGTVIRAAGVMAD